MPSITRTTSWILIYKASISLLYPYIIINCYIYSSSISFYLSFELALSMRVWLTNTFKQIHLQVIRKHSHHELGLTSPSRNDTTLTQFLTVINSFNSASHCDKFIQPQTRDIMLSSSPFQRPAPTLSDFNRLNISANGVLLGRTNRAFSGLYLITPYKEMETSWKGMVKTHVT